MNAGDRVTVHCAADGTDPETWMQGTIALTLARSSDGRHSVHVVDVTAFKWEWSDPWGEYDGVPQILARECSETAVLEWVDTWPRR